MPLYEYQCQECGRTVEVIQKFSDDPLSECSHCSGTLERLLSAPAIQFKGSGWYITDYARGKNGDGAKTAKAEGGESAKSEAADKPSKEAKTATDSTSSAKSFKTESKKESPPPSK